MVQPMSFRIVSVKSEKNEIKFLFHTLCFSKSHRSQGFLIIISSILGIFRSGYDFHQEPNSLPKLYSID